ncbi:hypothetical protein M2263_001173 [Providencia alcalifaciens]|nr:hypothetical protein [Providencia alcalifaciens]
MYSTGKITTTANNTKVIGTNTKWKDNNSLVSPEQVILIQNGATIYINSIASIQSNTEMTLSFPVPAAVKDAAYNILTTMVHSVSDAANKIVAMNNANVQFSDILNRWATETGTITVTLPDGTTQQLRTAKEQDKLLDGKLDTNKPEAKGALTIKAVDDYAGLTLTKGSDERVKLETLVDSATTALNIVYRDAAGKNVSIVGIPKKSGIAMLVGESGIGVASYEEKGAGDRNESRFIQYGSTPVAASQGYPGAGGGIQISYTASRRAQIFMSRSPERLHYRFSDIEGVDLTTKWKEIYSTANTTKDSNGNLKAASPIVKVFADHIESNEESEGVELKKLHTGIYQLKNVLGMHSDASWGGINGGITIPSGINQLPLVYADYDVLVAGERHPFNGELVTQNEHGDIVIYTSYRKHFDLPQNVQYAHLKTYPEFTKVVNDEQVELENGEPVDIPNGHWIDVRVNMPSNSIYNQKQAEAEAHAKEEAERVAREEAERVEQEEEQLI